MRQLLITTPDGASKTVRLDGVQCSLGRSLNNDLSFPDDAGLSRQHLSFSASGDTWLIRDLGSKNGTFVNGIRLIDDLPQPLKPGDTIAASAIVLLYGDDQTPGPGATAELPAWSEPAVPGGILMGRQPEPLATGAFVLTPFDIPPLVSPWPDAATALRRYAELAPERPLKELHQKVLELALEAVGAKCGTLALGTPDSVESAAYQGDSPFAVGYTLRDKLMREQVSVLVPETSPSHPQALAAPLSLNGEVSGFLYLHTPASRPFRQEDVLVLTALAELAAVRLRNASVAAGEPPLKSPAATLPPPPPVPTPDRLGTSTTLPPPLPPFPLQEAVPAFTLATPPSVPGLELAVQHTPGRGIERSAYYDFLPYPDNLLGLALGHAPSNSSTTPSMLQSRVRSLAETTINPGELLTRLNLALLGNGAAGIGMFLLVLEPNSGQIIYCNAGHAAPLLVRQTGTVEYLRDSGGLLGQAAVQYQPTPQSVQSGDVLVLYSPSVLQARNASGEVFGEQRLASLVTQSRQLPAESLAGILRQTIQAWGQGQGSGEDLTFVVLRRAFA